MMINETKLQIPDEYKEKIQVIYKDKDGYWAYGVGKRKNYTLSMPVRNKILSKKLNR